MYGSAYFSLFLCACVRRTCVVLQHCCALLEVRVPTNRPVLCCTDGGLEHEKMSSIEDMRGGAFPRGVCVRACINVLDCEDPQKKLGGGGVGVKRWKRMVVADSRW